MARQYTAARRKPGISSITYWRKFAQHRLIYLMLAAVFGFGMVAYFGSGGPMGGSANQRVIRGQDAIVTVNGEPVTQAEFENKWGEMKRFFGSNDTMAAQFQGNTISQLIQSALATSLAKQKNLSVSDADIDKAIDEQKKAGGKPIPDSDWEKMLEAQGTNERELRDNLRTALLPAALFQTFKDQVKVTDEDLLKSYDEVKARKIVIMRVPEAQAKTRLDKIKDEIKKGMDFAAAANKFSEDPANKSQFPDPKTKKMVAGAPKGGDMGWVPLTAGGALDPAELEALKKLKPGEISDSVKVPMGTEIIKVEQTRRNVPPDFAKNKVKLLDDYKTTQARTPFTKYMEDQQKKAKIVWNEPMYKWRYDYAQSNPMGGAAITGDAIKKQADIKQELRDYTVKHPQGDGSAALVLAKMLESEYLMTKGPRHDELRNELVKLYDQGIKNVEDAQARMRLATLYLEAGKPQDALAQYERQQKLLSWDQTPGSKYLHTQLEAAFKKLGKLDLAAKETKKIAQLTAEEKKAADERKKQEEERKKAEAEAKKKAAANPVKPGPAAPTKESVTVPGGTINVSPTPAAPKR